MTATTDTSVKLAQLEQWSEATREAEATAKHNAAGRDNLIREAIKDKVSVADIVTATKLTRARVYQIRDSK